MSEKSKVVKAKAVNQRDILKPYTHHCGHCGEPTNNIILCQRRRIICCSFACAGAEVV